MHRARSLQSHLICLYLKFECVFPVDGMCLFSIFRALKIYSIAARNYTSCICLVTFEQVRLLYVCHPNPNSSANLNISKCVIQTVKESLLLVSVSSK